MSTLRKLGFEMDMGPGQHRVKKSGRHRAPWYTQIDRYAALTGKTHGTFKTVSVGSFVILFTFAVSASSSDFAKPVDILPVTVSPATQPAVPTSDTRRSSDPSDRVIVNRTPSQRVTPTSTQRNSFLRPLPTPKTTQPAPRKSGRNFPRTSPKPSPSPSPAQSSKPASDPTEAPDSDTPRKFCQRRGWITD